MTRPLSPEQTLAPVAPIYSSHQADLTELIPKLLEHGKIAADFYDDNRNFVSGIKPLNYEIDSPHGTTKAQVFTMRNGRKLEVVSGQPYHQQSDVPIVFTTALGTSIRGHNEHTFRRNLALGLPTVMVGPEGGHADWPTTVPEWGQFLRNLFSIDLVETAENMHEVLEVTDNYEFYEPGTIATIGESRAAVTAIGVKARAAKFGRNVVYTDTTAPVFPVSAIEMMNAGELSVQTAKQLASIIRLPLKMNLRRAIHYPATLNPNPYYLMHMIANIPTLLSGKAGELGREVTFDAAMHHTHFDGDGWSGANAWDEIFDPVLYPNVVNTRRPGTHMAIANELTLQERETRLGGLRDELNASHNQPNRIDWRNVHMGALALLAS